MNFENLITTIQANVSAFWETQTKETTLALVALWFFVFWIYRTLKKETILGGLKRERVYKKWLDSELIDVYDAFNHVSYGLWCDWKRVKLKEKQMDGYNGRIISAHGQFFQYAFRASGCRIIVCSNYKRDKVYRY